MYAAPHPLAIRARRARIARAVHLRTQQQLADEHDRQQHAATVAMIHHAAQNSRATQAAVTFITGAYRDANGRWRDVVTHRYVKSPMTTPR